MKEYNLKITNHAPDNWNDIEKAHVDCFPWGGAERAYATYGQLAYAKTSDEKTGLYIHLFCEEKSPVSCETQLDGHVYLDSCMEFFFGMYDADASGSQYVNIETNSLGVTRISLGEGRHGRLFLNELGIERFPVSVSISDEGWDVFLFAPEASLKKLFGLSEIGESTVMRGNFYKCDENAGAPFGAWSPIDTPAPDFHRPEYFGNIIIKK